MTATPAAVLALVFAGLALATACEPAAIGDYPDTETKLPDRKKTSDNGDNTTSSSGGADAAAPIATPTSFAITISLKGTGVGNITSTPPGVTCATGTCKGTFPKNTDVTLEAAPTSGSLFAGWSQACSGDTKCAATLSQDINVGAEFQTLSGKWIGTYTNTRDKFGCTFNNGGNLSIDLSASGATFSTTGDLNGLELRNTNNCTVVGSTTGAMPATNVTIDGAKISGTWNFNVQVGGSLDFPFTATVAGGKINGTWTCPTCKGGFTLTKQ